MSNESLISETNLQFRNDLVELDNLHLHLSRIGQACGINDKTVFELTLACEELLTNIIRYGYSDQAERWIELSIRVFESSVVIDLTDDGIGFNPLAQPEAVLGAELDERPVGGLGIHFVRRVMDELQYERTNGRNRMTLHKKWLTSGGVER